MTWRIEVKQGAIDKEGNIEYICMSYMKYLFAILRFCRVEKRRGRKRGGKGEERV